jgi:hypothetical protein
MEGPVNRFLILCQSYLNMVDMGNTCFWLVKIRKISPLKLQGQMKYNLVGIMYGRSRKQIPNFVPIILKHGCHGNTCFWLVVVRLSGEPHSLSSLSLYIRQKIYHVLNVILFWRNKPNQTINFITYYGGTCLERPLFMKHHPLLWGQLILYLFYIIHIINCFERPPVF